MNPLSINFEDAYDVKDDDICSVKQRYSQECPTVMYERFDKHKLKWIIDHPADFLPFLTITDPDYDPFHLPKQYLLAAENCETAVKYAKSSIDNMGRLFAVGSLSMQSFCCEIRHTIAAEYYDDVDMVNCHPVILAAICDRQDPPIQHDFLNEYIRDREVLFSDILDLNEDMCRKDVKKCILSMINGGSKAYNSIPHKTQWLTEFRQEILSIKSDIADLYEDFYERVKQHNIDNPKKDKKKNRNHADSALNVLFCDEEHKILMHMCDYLSHKGYVDNDVCLCFDGVMIRKKNGKTIDDKTVQETAKYASTMIGFDISLSVKPMDCGFEMPEHIPQYNNHWRICPEDPFVWVDFDCKYRGKRYDTLSQCIKATVYDLRRVMARIEMGGSFVVKKSDCNDHLYGQIKMSDYITDMYFLIGTDKIKRCTFKTYLADVVKVMKQYKTIDFVPGSKDRNVFNLFRGYKAKMLPSYNVHKFKLVYQHLRDIVCGGDLVSFGYLMTWFANMFQYPGKKTGVVPFLYSEKQGTGKNTAFSFISKCVIGSHMCREMAGLRPLCEKHNTILAGRKLLIVNEAIDREGGFASNFDKLKTIISDSRLFIDPKGRDGYDIQNNVEIVISSNNLNALKIEESDRRYLCLEVSDAKVGDTAYFKALYASMTDSAGDHFFTFVIKEFGDKRLGLPPMTELKKKIKYLSMPNPRRFMEIKPWIVTPDDNSDDESDDDSDDDEEKKDAEIVLTGVEIYRLFVSWCQDEGIRNVHSKKMFECCVSSYLSPIKKMIRGKRKFVLSNL